MSDERFARVPTRLHRALKAREISFAVFTLEAYLIGIADPYRAEVVTTLGRLRDETRWPWTTNQHVRDTLSELEELGEVEVVGLVQGQRTKPFTIRLLAHDIGMKASPDFQQETLPSLEVERDVQRDDAVSLEVEPDLQPEGAVSLEVTSNGQSRQHDDGPPAEGKSGGPRLSTLLGPPDTEPFRQEEKHPDQTGLRDESQELHTFGRAIAAKLDGPPLTGAEALEDLLRSRDPAFDESSSRTLRRLLGQLPAHTAQYARDELEAATGVRKPTAFIVRMLQRRIERAA